MASSKLKLTATSLVGQRQPGQVKTPKGTGSGGGTVVVVGTVNLDFSQGGNSQYLILGLGV